SVTTETSVESFDDLKEKVLQWTREFQGIHISEYSYDYEKQWGQDTVHRKRYALVIWIERDDPRDAAVLRNAFTEIFFKEAVDIRNLAYRRDILHQVQFPAISLRDTNEPQEIVTNMIQRRNVFLSHEQKQAAISGLSLFIQALKNNGINISDNGQDTRYANIEIINNLTGRSLNGSLTTVIDGHSFVFGLKDHAAKKFDNFYKQTIVVSLAFLIEIGERGKILDSEIEAIRQAVVELSFASRAPSRGIKEILNGGHGITGDLDEQHVADIKAEIAKGPIRPIAFDDDIPSEMDGVKVKYFYLNTVIPRAPPNGFVYAEFTDGTLHVYFSSVFLPIRLKIAFLQHTHEVMASIVFHELIERRLIAQGIPAALAHNRAVEKTLIQYPRFAQELTDFFNGKLADNPSRPSQRLTMLPFFMGADTTTVLVLIPLAVLLVFLLTWDRPRTFLKRFLDPDKRHRPLNKTIAQEHLIVGRHVYPDGTI
ncbi:MAG: hypothetical protein AAB276_03125, partial [Pseudomonadota bacterium]